MHLVFGALMLSLTQILAHHQVAVHPAGAGAPLSVESRGTLQGGNLHGEFHSWHRRDDDRLDQNLGPRHERTLTLGAHRFFQNSSGDVIELRGLLLRRAITQDFISSDDLFEKAEYSVLLGQSQLADGRAVYRLAVTPPGGESETIDIDAQTYLLDRIEYIDQDGLFTVDFSDYRNRGGTLFPYKSVQSDGDHAFDVTQTTSDVLIDHAMDADVFAPLAASMVDVRAPVTVALSERNGALYAPVSIHGRAFTFLVDSGAQGMVVDTHVAAVLGLEVQGSLEAKGATRSGGLGIASLDSIQIGSATVPVGAVSVLDLAASTRGRFPIEGILGFPLFGAAAVQIDFANLAMTIGKPGSANGAGERFDVDVDRELPEVTARVNGTDGRFLLDTGNGNELLLFHHFLDANAGMLPFAGAPGENNYGIGGSTRASSARVDELDIGSYRLFHRFGTVILSDKGAFADRFEDGNIGLGVLRNFVVTFDLVNRTLYLQRGALFRDGSERG
ncbi:MAG: hypothetical protein DLM50_08555 [Candidatus Meridianibacter frigidus]|nr:MAG: hypothetical protein DLM50_08555 [Candidatus Eremiobacteraeota bacterium]